MGGPFIVPGESDPSADRIAQRRARAQRRERKLYRHSVFVAVDGGLVKAEFDRHKNLVDIQIDQKAAEDINVLEDLVVAVAAEGGRHVDLLHGRSSSKSLAVGLGAGFAAAMLIWSLSWRSGLKPSSVPEHSPPELTAPNVSTIQPSRPPPFPWPPPRASSKKVISWDLFVKDGSRPLQIGDVSNLLEGALDEAGYNETSFYPLINGFALVTRLEEIDEAGAPLPGQLRWPTRDREFRALTGVEFAKALFLARPGYFRVVVFILEDEPFATTGSKPTDEQATGWLSDGLNYLPPELAQKSLNHSHRLTALVYEFQKRRKSEAAAITIPGRLAAAIHLRKSGVLIALERLK